MQNNEVYYQKENNKKGERKERTGRHSITGNDEDFKAKIRRMKEIIHDFKGNNSNR